MSTLYLYTSLRARMWRGTHATFLLGDMIQTDSSPLGLHHFSFSVKQDFNKVNNTMKFASDSEKEEKK